MVPVMETLISTVLGGLRGDIAAANVQGNAEGLLARHFLGDDARLGFDWVVDSDQEWLESHYDPSSLPSVAALAFTVSRHATEAMLDNLDKGLARAVGRDATAASQNITLHSPPVLIGLVLAANLFRERAPQYLTWCREVIRALKANSSGRADALVAYAGSLASVQVSVPAEFEGESAFELAAREWLSSLSSSTTNPPGRRTALKQALVEQVLREDAGSRAAHEAALIWRTVQNAISEATSDLLRSPETVVHVLAQFEASMRRWRWDALDLKAPLRWPVVSEREVQDILYLMLRPVFLDLEDEDTLPKFGHSTYRADFGIPSLGLLIEAKYARSAGDFKDIEKEVLEDIVPYLQTPERYNRIVVFIYDHSASVQVHETTARALRRAPGIDGVVIASRPSHLPYEQSTVSPKASLSTLSRARKTSTKSPRSLKARSK
jgi:hypothetical protein